MSGVIAGITAAFGMASSISNMTASKRALERANKEAALAVAQARDNISKIPMLEKGIPAIAIEQIQKDALRQRKQLLDAVRGSGQRSVLGAAPAIGEQILKEKETQRGVIEKQLQAREDEIVKAKQAQQDTELEMLTAAGAAAQQRAAKAANQQAQAVGSLISSAGALAGSVMEGSDLFGGENRRQDNALKGIIAGADTDVNLDEFRDYVTNLTDSEGVTLSQEALTNTINDPNNTLLEDFIALQGKGTDIDTGVTTGQPS